MRPDETNADQSRRYYTRQDGTRGEEKKRNERGPNITRRDEGRQGRDKGKDRCR